MKLKTYINYNHKKMLKYNPNQLQRINSLKFKLKPLHKYEIQRVSKQPIIFFHKKFRAIPQ